MTVIEYRPSANLNHWKQPDHLSDRPSFNSRCLGKIISTAGVPYLSLEEVDELFLEITQEIHTLASRISSQRWPLLDLHRMKAKKQDGAPCIRLYVQGAALELRLKKGAST
jgi:hypothetical protein